MKNDDFWQAVYRVVSIRTRQNTRLKLKRGIASLKAGATQKDMFAFQRMFNDPIYGWTFHPCRDGNAEIARMRREVLRHSK